MKKHLPSALRGIALAVLFGWALDVHVPGFDTPIVPDLQQTETPVQVQPLQVPQAPRSAQVTENKAEIKSYKEQVEAAKARQWKQAADQVTQTVAELTQIPELPALENLPSLGKIPELFSADDKPKINEPPPPQERQTFSELTNIEDMRQTLPPTGSALPQETSVQSMSQAAADMVEAVRQGLEATQEVLSQWVEEAKSVVNETAAAATESVTHVANAVEAEVAPIPTVSAPEPAPAVVQTPAAVETPVAVETPAAVDIAAPVNPPLAAQPTPATPMSIEPKAEVLANAPATTQAETAAPLYPKVGSPKAKAEVVAEEPPPSVVLKEIRFKGAKYFSNESLQALVGKFLGIPLQYNDLLDVGYAVENFYKKNNHLARVMLTQQDVTEGILTLDVIESKLSKITVDQQLGTLPSTQEHVLALIEEQHPKGSTPSSPVDLNTLEVLTACPSAWTVGAWA